MVDALTQIKDATAVLVAIVALSTDTLEVVVLVPLMLVEVTLVTLSVVDVIVMARSITTMIMFALWGIPTTLLPKPRTLR